MGPWACPAGSLYRPSPRSDVTHLLHRREGGPTDGPCVSLVRVVLVVPDVELRLLLHLHGLAATPGLVLPTRALPRLHAYVGMSTVGVTARAGCAMRCSQGHGWGCH